MTEMAVKTKEIWNICKSFAPLSSQIVTTSILILMIFTGLMPFLPPNQQHQST